MAAAALPLIEAGAALEPVVVNLIKKAIGLFHHTKVPAPPGAPATKAGTVPLTPAQAQATNAAVAATAQTLIATAVKNGSLPASAIPDAALLPGIIQILYGLMPPDPVAPKTATTQPSAVGAPVTPLQQAIINAVFGKGE